MIVTSAWMHPNDFSALVIGRGMREAGGCSACGSGAGAPARPGFGFFRPRAAPWRDRAGSGAARRCRGLSRWRRSASHAHFTAGPPLNGFTRPGCPCVAADGLPRWLSQKTPPEPRSRGVSLCSGPFVPPIASSHKPSPRYPCIERRQRPTQRRTDRKTTKWLL